MHSKIYNLRRVLNLSYSMVIVFFLIITFFSNFKKLTKLFKFVSMHFHFVVLNYDETNTNFKNITEF